MFCDDPRCALLVCFETQMDNPYQGRIQPGCILSTPEPLTFGVKFNSLPSNVRRVDFFAHGISCWGLSFCSSFSDGPTFVFYGLCGTTSKMKNTYHDVGSTIKTCCQRLIFVIIQLEMCHTISAEVSEHLNGYISACNHSDCSRKCLTQSLFVVLIVAKRIKSLAQLLHAQITAQTRQPLILLLMKNH